MAKVSVIVPNFNHAAYLEQRLETVLGQTYRDFDVVLLDDASTDGSVPILERYAHHPMVRDLVVNSSNTGSPFEQWRNGVSRTSGEYVWIAESDDFADAAMLERLAGMLDRSPSVGIAYCQSWAVDGNGQRMYSLRQWTDDLSLEHWAKDFVNAGVDECKRHLVVKCTIPNASAVLFRRRVYEQVGGPDDGFRVAGDWMLWAKMLLRCDVAFAAEGLNYFRRHAGTVRNSGLGSTDGLMESIRIVKYLLASVEVTQKVYDQAIDRLIARWLSAADEGRFSVMQHLAIYRAIHGLDPSIAQRLAVRLARAFAKRVVRSAVR